MLGGLGGQSIARHLTAAARAAGIDGRITGHSGRVGLASESGIGWHPLGRRSIVRGTRYRQSQVSAETRHRQRSTSPCDVQTAGARYDSLPLPIMKGIPLAASGRFARLKNKDAIEAEQKRLEGKKAKAQSMVFRHVIEKKPLADSWFDVYPESKATRKQAKKMAGLHIKWYRLNFPLAIREVLYMKGLDAAAIVDLIYEQLEATTPLKTGETRYETKDENGNVVRKTTYEFTYIRNDKTFNEGLRNAITLSGFHGRVLKPSAAEEEADRMRNVTEPEDTVKIEPREKLPDDEWQRQYQQAIAESKADEKANAAIRDLKRRVAEAESGQVTHQPRGFTGPPNHG